MADPAFKPFSNPATAEAQSDLFADASSLRDLDRLVDLARRRGAAKLLVLAGKPLVCRINGQLSEPLAPGRVHFRQTERLVDALLSAEQKTILDADGAVELEYSPSTGEHIAESNGKAAVPVQIHVFFGDGAHNLVLFLE